MMQRKPGYPVANCNIKMPEPVHNSSDVPNCEEDPEQQQKRLRLVNFGHSQWGFNNWSWKVTKQELDFVDFSNGKYNAGVAAYVSISVKNLDIHRENIGYATSSANNKGFAIYKSRKTAVTNALKETLFSFGGTVAAELQDWLEAPMPNGATTEAPHSVVAPAPAPTPAIPPAMPPAPVPPSVSATVAKPDFKGRPPRRDSEAAVRPTAAPINLPTPAVVPPVAKAHPMPIIPPHRAPVPRPPVQLPVQPPIQPPVPIQPSAPIQPPAPVQPAAPHLRPNSNVGACDANYEEARAERKRRQRQAQEEFRQIQLLKQRAGLDDKQELNRNSSSFDNLLLQIPSQDIVIEETGSTVAELDAKRKSPGDGGAAKRRSVTNRLDIVQAD